jgi:hypothetical protein
MLTSMNAECDVAEQAYGEGHMSACLDTGPYRIRGTQ